VAPPEVVRASKIHHNVHLGPGVTMDSLMSKALGVGLRYLLFCKYNDSLLINAYNDFCARLHWKVYFMKEMVIMGLNEVPDNYNPDYDLHLP
jgi:hypothetical protein